MTRREILDRCRQGLWPLTWPMGLTLLRVMLVPVFLCLLLFTGNHATGAVSVEDKDLNYRRWAAMAVFAVMALTDKLDGYLARKLKQTSLLGTLLDPAADKLLVTSALVLLCFPRFAPAGFAIPWVILIGVYLKDVGVIIGALVIRHRLQKVEINASLPGKISTVVQLTLIIGTLLAPDMIRWLSPDFAAGMIWFLWWATVIAAAAAAIDYACEGARQLRNAAARHLEELEPAAG